ncbi:MAG: FAD-binding protein, partial [Flavobacteriaceae bacterium]|nr:FAD-binding protein [Flavobacteriaceae bacterium]
MVKELQLRIQLKEDKIADILLKKAAHHLSIKPSTITGIKVLRKSLDARKPQIYFNYKVAIYINESLPKTSEYQFEYKDVSNAKEIHIVGFGPAGMYAALRCIELGFKPIVLERGKNVQDRRRDLKAINQDHFVNEDSNYCFGEGGAGTYSDGKLYTRSLKRGDVR